MHGAVSGREHEHVQDAVEHAHRLVALFQIVFARVFDDQSTLHSNAIAIAKGRPRSSSLRRLFTAS
ncbi:MAG: hypothetical protein JWP29_383 [Rhodoferax sp.]|nr:hypothetical protein [Rhodoferax sp.]